MKISEVQPFLKAKTDKLREELKKQGRIFRGNLRLAPGTIVEASDRNYRVGDDGAWRREDPKPFRSKKQRVKARRESRQ